MRVRKYQRKANLKREYKEQYTPARKEWLRRFSAWDDVMKRGLSDMAQNSISDLLARLGFEPDEEGIPQGDWPPITKATPLSLLDALSRIIVIEYPDDLSIESVGLRQMLDLLNAATLFWAGAIDREGIKKDFPNVSFGLVWLLLNASDMKGFWDRPGVGMTEADIRHRWATGCLPVADVENLADMLRRAKGSTSRQ